MKIAVLIPTRGDRPQLLANCLRMMAAQTLRPAHIEIVDDAPSDECMCDITVRYRTGYDRLRNQGFNLIALIEDDDWYHPEYLETMVIKWIEAGQPDILGTDYTIYYHLRLKKWFVMNHPRRASAMNTLIKPDLNFKWCPDHEPYTDLHLWQILEGKGYTQGGAEFLYSLNQAGKLPAGKNWPDLSLTNAVVNCETDRGLISMGMKHGIGQCGGRNHHDRLERFTEDDSQLQFLRTFLDEDSFNFYSKLF